MESVEINGEVSSIDQFAFKGFSSLKTVNIVNIASNLISINNGAFLFCSGLTSISLPYSVTSIAVSAFYGCESLLSISIPSGVSSLSEYTFYGCKSLKTVNITSNLTSIGNNTFEGCSSLSSITIPPSVTSIGSSAFQGCESLTSITIPSGVTSMNDYTFYKCSSLNTVNVTSNLISIGHNAFHECKNLSSINIPSSVTSIGSSAFQNCESLTSITIPSGVTSIDNYTFFRCINLKTVNITSVLTSKLGSIGKNAFYDCFSLSSIDIPSSVTSIGPSAFSGCKSLPLVTIRSGSASIASNAFFSSTNLTSVVYLGPRNPIEPNITTIFEGCRQLKFVCVPPTYQDNSFCGLSEFCYHESCESFLYNQCFEPICDGGMISTKKRENATNWEDRSNGCYEFQCLHEGGPVYWKQCNKTNQICENDQCVTKEEVLYSVVIEVEGIDVTNMNMTEIQRTISNLTNIDTDKIRIRVEVNENNDVTRIIVVVDDQTTAEAIKKRIDSAINEHSQKGIIRHFKSAKVKVNELSISSGVKKEERKTMITVVFMALLISNYLL